MKKYIFVAIVLLALEFSVQISLSLSDSQTTDEGVHLSAGYTYLTRRDFRFNPEHPPLVKELAALPLLFAKLNVPEDSKYWDKAGDFFYDSWRENRQFGEELLYGLGNDAAKILLLSRIPMIAITVILGVAIFIISSRFWGAKGGLISLSLFVLDPLILGHGHLVTTDIAVSLGYLLAVYCFWLFLNHPSWKNVVLLGLAVGLAELAKFTAIIIFPSFLVLFLVFLMQNKIKLKETGKILGKLAVALLIVLLVISCGYFFTQKGMLREYFKGLSMVFYHAGTGHSSFLLGETSKTGWWYYFPVLYFLKTPIPTLILVMLGTIFALKDKTNFKRNLFIGLAALLFLGFAMTSKANLGLRHIMPIMPIFFVLAGSLAQAKIRCIQYIAAGAVVWLAVIFLFSYPYYFSYFNEFAGGAKNGYKVANDSNLDWGQDILRIKNYLSERGIENAFIDYSWDGDLSLDYYNIPHSPNKVLDNNFEGYAVISATSLQLDIYKWLRDNYHPFSDRAIPSVLVYYVDGGKEREWQE